MVRIDDKDDNEFSGGAPHDDSKVVTPKEDFDRNRDGVYGGLPKARDKSAEGSEANTPHAAKN